MNPIKLKTIQKNFLKELKDAHGGKKTSLPFIIHKLSPSPIVRNGEVFQTFVIGGSVARTATLRKNGRDIKILNNKEDQINFKTEKDLLSFFEDKIGKDIRVIALNFAYPIKPVFEKGRLDGILLKVTKEGGFRGLIGKKIGKEIEDYVFEKIKKSSEAGSRSARKITVSIANDTVCLLLSGLTKYNWSELAGGVDGTGVNFAFFLGKQKLVNLEAANFNKFTKSKEAQMIDKESNNPSGWLFEKETAGAYLYKHFNIIIKNRKIDYPPINSTEELNELCHPEFISESKNKNRKKMLKQVQHDIVNASEIAKDLLKRSAQLVACQIAGITEFKKHDMVFNMEGSLFWKANNYKDTVEQTVKQLIPEYNVKFVEIENSGILGAAKLIS